MKMSRPLTWLLLFLFFIPLCVPAINPEIASAAQSQTETTLLQQGTQETSLSLSNPSAPVSGAQLVPDISSYSGEPASIENTPVIELAPTSTASNSGETPASIPAAEPTTTDNTPTVQPVSGAAEVPGTPNTLEASAEDQVLGQWYYDDPDVSHIVGQEDSIGWKASSSEQDGIIYKLETSLSEPCLRNWKNYQLTIKAAIEDSGQTGDKDPVVFDFDLFARDSQGQFQAIDKGSQVRASFFGDQPGSVKDLQFYFLLPDGLYESAYHGFALYINYHGNNSTSNNNYNLSINNVTLTQVGSMKASRLLSGQLVNLALLPDEEAALPEIADNPNFQVMPGVTGYKYIYSSYSVSSVGMPDTDGDTIPDEWEVNGYYFDTKSYTIKPKVEGIPDPYRLNYHYTDPTQWSSDGDPYSDYDEVTGANMDSSVFINNGDDPLIPAYPRITMQLMGYEMQPIRDITFTEAATLTNQDTYTSTTNKEGRVSIGLDVTGFAECGYKQGYGTDSGTGFYWQVGARAELSEKQEFAQTWSTNDEELEQTVKQWASAVTTNPDQAAKIKFLVKIKNSGNAPATGVIPDFNVKLGGQIIASIRMSDLQGGLGSPLIAPGKYYPNDTVLTVGMSGAQGVEGVIVTLDQLKAINMGVPITIEPIAENMQGSVMRWDPETHSWTNYGDWLSYWNQIESRTATVALDLADGSNVFNRIYAGSNRFDQQLTVAEALVRGLDGECRTDGIYIQGNRIDERWRFYFSDLDGLMAQLEAMPEGQRDLLSVKLSPGQSVLIKEPDSDLKLEMYSAWLSKDNKTIYACVYPGDSELRSVVANITFAEGGETQLSLVNSEGSPVYSCTAPKAVAAGEVIAVDSSLYSVKRSIYVPREESTPAMGYIPLSNAVTTSQVNSVQSGGFTVPIADYSNAEAFLVNVRTEGLSGIDGSVTVGDSQTRLNSSDSGGSWWRVRIFEDDNYGDEMEPGTPWDSDHYFDLNTDSQRLQRSDLTNDPDSVMFGNGLGDDNPQGRKNNRKATVTLYDAKDFSGSSITLDVDTPILKDITTNAPGSHGWHDVAESARLNLSNENMIGAQYSPTHSHLVIVKKPKDQNFINVSWNAGGVWGHLSKGDPKDYKVAVDVVGYFVKKANGGAGFSWYTAPEDSPNGGTATWTGGNLSGNFGVPGIAVSGQNDSWPTAYLVQVTDRRISSNQVAVVLNGVSTDLGTSPSTGTTPGCSHPPVHSHQVLVPATNGDVINYEIQKKPGDQADEWSSMPAGSGIDIKVLGYYTKYTQGCPGYYISANELVKSQRSSSCFKIGTSETVTLDDKYKDAKAYVLKIQTPRMSADMFSVRANGVTSDFAASSTNNGKGIDPALWAAPIHSHYIVVPNLAGKEGKIEISSTKGGWSTVNGSDEFAVWLCGYYDGGPVYKGQDSEPEGYLLTSLQLDKGSVSPTFAPEIMDYVVDVASDEVSQGVKINLAPQASSSVITIDGAAYTSGQDYTLSVANGTKVVITVTTGGEIRQYGIRFAVHEAGKPYVDPGVVVSNSIQTRIKVSNNYTDYDSSQILDFKLLGENNSIPENLTGYNYGKGSLVGLLVHNPSDPANPTTQWLAPDLLMGNANTPGLGATADPAVSALIVNDREYMVDSNKVDAGVHLQLQYGLAADNPLKGIMITTNAHDFSLKSLKKEPLGPSPIPTDPSFSFLLGGENESGAFEVFLPNAWLNALPGALAVKIFDESSTGSRSNEKNAYFIMRNSQGGKTLVCTDLKNNARKRILITWSKDTTAPVVTGVEDGGIYTAPVTVCFNEGTATLDGSVFYSGSTVKLDGAHVLVVTDAAGNVTTVNFTINIPESNNRLISLTVNGRLVPQFNPAVLNYSIAAGAEEKTMLVKAVPESNNASVIINRVPGNEASVTIRGGINDILIEVKAEDGKCKNYDITVTRPLSSLADLSGLTLSEGTLTPLFNSQTAAYTAFVKHDTGSITITPTASDLGALILVNGEVVASGTASAPFNLNAGKNNFTIWATAEDGVAEKGYELTVIRPQLITLSAAQPQATIGTDSAAIVIPQDINNGSIKVTPLAGAQSSSCTLPLLQVFRNTPEGDIVLTIPDGTVITGPASWDGTIHLLQIRPNDSLQDEANPGNGADIAMVVEIGCGDMALNLSKGVRLCLPGQAGKKAGSVRQGLFTPVAVRMATDNQETADTLAAGGDGLIDAGSDLALWTKHFTCFVVYGLLDAGEVTNLTLTPANAKINVTWTDPGTATLSKIRVYCRPADETEYPAPLEVNPGVGLCTINQLMNGRPYKVKVSTVNNTGTESVGVESVTTPLPLQAAPDLMFGSDITLSSGSLYPGSKFKVSYTLLNNGGADAGAFKIHFYLVDDIDADKGSGVLLGEKAVKGLLAGKSTKGSVSLKIPSNIAFPDGYIIANIDPYGSVKEIDDWANNTNEVPVSILYPDLVMVEESGQIVGTPAPGATITIKDILLNDGESSSPKTQVTYYLWDGSNVSSRILLAKRSVAALKPDRQSKGKVKAVIPSLSAGTWYIQAVVDVDNLVIESNDDNNVLDFDATITV